MRFQLLSEKIKIRNIKQSKKRNARPKSRIKSSGAEISSNGRQQNLPCVSWRRCGDYL